MFNVNSTTLTSSTSTAYIYELVSGGITSPTNNTIIAQRYYNFSWQNATVNPSGAAVRVVNFSVELYNSDGTTLNTTLAGTGNLNLSNVDVYNLNLATGIYWVKVTSYDNTSNSTSTSHQFNLTRNTLINITAISAINGGTISSFDGWVYHYETGLNLTYNTTSGQALVDFIRGNITAYINAENYSLLTNTTLVGFNDSVAQYNQRFSLYETNTLNITFYDQATPTTILNTTTILLDLISDLYANNYSTTNGTMYLTLLTPETYTLRYRATGYEERFYIVTVDNRSFQNIKLYLINSSVASNVTVTVVNQVLNPVQGAVVKALKYYLPNNTYILQEIGTTNVEGQVIMSLTLNSEFYKFIVEYPSGTVVEITDPSYITSTSITIPISQTNDIIEEYTEFAGITSDVDFNPTTLNFRFDFSDTTNTASTYCLYVFRMLNGSQTAYNSTCTNAASGTLLAGVANITGTTYLAKATYTQNNVERFLDQAIYEFPSSSPLGNRSGLWLQFILTLGFSLLFLLNATLGIIMFGVSIILGKLVGINIFSWVGAISITTACVAVGFMLSLKKAQ